MIPLMLSQHTSLRVTEVGFLLLVIAGVWLALAELLGERWRRFRMVVSGTLIAAGGVLLIIATHYGTLV